MHRFTVYGLVVSTDRKLVGYHTAPKDTPPDITLYMGTDQCDVAAFAHVCELSYRTAISPQKLPLPPDSDDSHSEDFCYRITYWNNIEFVINARGTDVWAQWPKDVDFDLVAAYVSGPILGFVLRLRGIICLHASVVEIDGHAIALLGPSGSGKSTMATAMALKGYPILSDDILVVKPSLVPYHAQPGYPGVRLCPDSLAILLKNDGGALRLTPAGDKRYLELPRFGCRFRNEARPLAAVYTGGSDQESSCPEFKTVSHADAFKKLLLNKYPGNYYKFPSSLRAAELKHLVQLTRKIPLREISFQRKMDRLSDLCDALAEDAGMLIRESDNPIRK